MDGEGFEFHRSPLVFLGRKGGSLAKERCRASDWMRMSKYVFAI
jgi:hypothetical protein